MKESFIKTGLAALCLMAAIPPALPHAPATTTVQFDREIVRILDNHCVMCHAEKSLAFPLVTYEQTYVARWKIRQSALDRHMPPWGAVPGYGEFANDNSLTQREIDFLSSWAESYGPRNNGEVYRGTTVQAPSKPIQAHTDFESWELGKPDALLPIPANRVVDPKLKSERWLRGLEYKPANRRTVRAVSFKVQETGQWIGTWTPWYGFVSFPQPSALRLPAGSHVVADVDQGSIALYYAEKPSPHPVSTLVLEAKRTARLSGDMNLLALQVQQGAKSIEVSAKDPSGATRVLLFARNIPLDWPTPYVYKQPVSLPKGTELRAIGAAVTLSFYPK